jgi:hypothetical protein
MKETDKKIFLSWSGNLSKSIAKILKERFPEILNIELFFSAEDISIGTRWSNVLHDELTKDNFGIILVTRENLNSPWLLFELGVLAGKKEARVCALYFNLDIKELPSPMEQFNNVKYSEEGMYELLGSVNEVLGSPLNEGMLKKLFDQEWPIIQNKIQGVLESEDKTRMDKSQESKVDDALKSQLDIQDVQYRVSRLERCFNLLALSIETPAYFLDKDYRITYANLATTLVFELYITEDAGMSIGEMLEIKKDQVLNYDEIVQHHIEIFVKATKKPDCDFEIIKMNHQRYGHIELRKIAIALKNEKNEIEGWVVAFNITAIDKLQAYYDDMTRVIKGKFFS